jgi:hypothetical protein
MKIKKKRKRSPKVLHITYPEFEYIEELSDNSSHEQYSDDDIETDNNDHVHDAEATVAELNQQPATAAHARAFVSTTSEPVNNNN